MKPESLKQILEWLNLPQKLHAQAPIMITGAAVDSRLTQPGDLFIALPGAKVDGHQFLSAAAAKGARAALVRSDYKGPDYGMALIRTDNGLEALQAIASNYLKKSTAKIIGVTGSLGKTTTKGFITSLLKKRYRVSSSQANYNSQIGVSLTILNQVTLEEELIVMEMGMTHAGQIKRLVEIAPPTAALITTIAPVHIVNFRSLEELAQSKAEIFSHPFTKWHIYHKESDINGALSSAKQGKKISFSATSQEANFAFLNHGTELKDSEGNFVRLPDLPLLGAHNKHNLLAAIAMARQFGLSWHEISETIPELTLPERRLQLVEKGGIKFVNDSYNASEQSMKAAFASLPEPATGGKRCAVLAGIVDLGVLEKQVLLSVAESALEYLDILFCFGEECLVMVERWSKAQKPVFWAKERQGLLPILSSKLKAGDVVLLKGSCSKAVWEVLNDLEGAL